MNGSSPFGQYAPIVASVAAVGILGAYLVAIFVGNGNPVDTGLQNLAWLAAGTIFGSALAVNGWKAPLTATHSRLDKLTQAVSANASTLDKLDPTASATVSSILATDSIPPAVGSGNG